MVPQPLQQQIRMTTVLQPRPPQALPLTEILKFKTILTIVVRIVINRIIRLITTHHHHPDHQDQAANQAIKATNLQHPTTLMKLREVTVNKRVKKMPNLVIYHVVAVHRRQVFVAKQQELLLVVVPPLQGFMVLPKQLSVRRQQVMLSLSQMPTEWVLLLLTLLRGISRQIALMTRHRAIPVVL